MRKPTKKQARKYLIKKLIGEISGKDKQISEMKLGLNILMSGNVDDKIKISDYQDKSWYLDIDALGFSLWEFISKTKVIKMEVDRFAKSADNEVKG